MRVLTAFLWLGIETSVGCCGHGNEHSVSIKCCEFLEQFLASQEGLSSTVFFF
jgi:hypothetical protein